MRQILYWILLFRMILNNKIIFFIVNGVISQLLKGLVAVQIRVSSSNVLIFNVLQINNKEFGRMKLENCATA